MFKIQKKVDTKWSKKLSYAIGLITSDGYLHKDGRHLGYVSKELELIQNFKKALGLNNKIYKSNRGGEKLKNYFYIQFGDINFYKFLNNLGLTNAKSKTIRQVSIPKKYFADFLRGLYEGDGSFYTFWDKRWPNSFGYKLTFASASQVFLNWLKNTLNEYYGVKGFLHKGKGVWEIRYVKRDTEILYHLMYTHVSALSLKRKRDKIKHAIIFNRKNKPW